MLQAEADALVNPVNVVGVMGKGLALDFKRSYPAMFEAYARAARSGQLRMGRMDVHEVAPTGSRRYVINFPTKAHWRDKSRLGDIRDGLADLVSVSQRLGLASIAVPALGCGLGGLAWPQVEPLVVAAFEPLRHMRVLLFPPR